MSSTTCNLLIVDGIIKDTFWPCGSFLKMVFKVRGQVICPRPKENLNPRHNLKKPNY
jgi:hypothetical protein